MVIKTSRMSKLQRYQLTKLLKVRNPKKALNSHYNSTEAIIMRREQKQKSRTRLVSRRGQRASSSDIPNNNTTQLVSNHEVGVTPVVADQVCLKFTGLACDDGMICELPVT